MKIYSDNCCFNRSFDDQPQIRIKLEAEAKMRIQEDIQDGKFEERFDYTKWQRTLLEEQSVE